MTERSCDCNRAKTPVAPDAVLARVVDHDGVSVLRGMHHHALSPVDTAEAVRRARARLHRKRAVPVERLYYTAFGHHLIRYWEEAVEDLDVRSTIPPDLRNRDGDPLVLTVYHLEVTPEARAAIDAGVAGDGRRAAGSRRRGLVGARVHASRRRDTVGRRADSGRPGTDRPQGAQNRNQLAGAGRRAT